MPDNYFTMNFRLQSICGDSVTRSLQSSTQYGQEKRKYYDEFIFKV